MAQFRHGTGLDLADALPGQVEVFTDFFQGSRLAAVQPQPEFENLALAFVKWTEKTGNFLG